MYTFQRRGGAPVALLLLAALSDSVQGFSAGNAVAGSLALRAPGARACAGRPSARPACAALRMQTQDTETETQAAPPAAPAPPAPPAGDDRGTFMGTKNFVPDGGDWFDKTTNFNDRENNDPLAPVRKELRAKVPESRMVGLEKESTDWYKSQTKKRSMFGRTLNPLTGELQDIEEEGSSTLNPLEDPIFYVLLIVGAPIVVMAGAAQMCLVPALSLAFGFECAADYY